MLLALSSPSITQSTAYTNFIARTSGLDSTHLSAYRVFFNGLTDDGIFNVDGTTDYLDGLYIFATQDQTTALLNLVGNSFNLSLTGSPVFDADRGITCPLSSDFYSADVTTATHYTQNSAHVSFWDNIYFGAGTAMVQLDSDTGTGRTNIFPRFADGKVYNRVNDSPESSGFDVINNFGYHLGNRSSSTARQAYVNGVSVGTYGSTPSGTLVGTFTFKGIAMDQTAAASFGGDISSKQLQLYSRLNAFLQVIAGAPRAGFWAQPIVNSDASKIYVPQFQFNIQKSTDTGGIWSTADQGHNREWTFGSCTPDGTIVYIPDYFAGTVMKSTDSGENFSPLPIGSDVPFCAQSTCSSDGTVVLAAFGADQSGQGRVWLSKDSGATWTDQGLGRGHWAFSTVSADGMKMATAIGGNTPTLYVSVNGGTTWTARQTGTLGQTPFGVYSQDGSTLYTSYSPGGNLSKSTDDGVSFSSVGPAGVFGFYFVDCSDDGSVVAACQFNDHPWISNNGGSTWTEITSIPLNQFPGLSSDGSIIVIAAYMDYVYLSTDSGASFSKTTASGSV